MQCDTSLFFVQCTHYYSHSNQVSNETGGAHSRDYREVVSNLLKKLDGSQKSQKRGQINFFYHLISIPFASLEAYDRDEIQCIMLKTKLKFFQLIL